MTPGSPFARKCRVVARERGLLGRMQEVTAMPMEDDPRLLAANPIAQVPTLELDDETSLIDSPVICAYLDGLGGDPRLLPPPSAAEHWRVRRTEALADAALEMAVKLTLEGRRPEAGRSAAWVERWTRGLNRSLDVLEAETRTPMRLDLGQIALGCIGGYLDLRHASLDWRRGRPRLEAFTREIEQLDSFLDTAPA